MIVINSAPGQYYSVNGDLIFVVYEATKANDPVTYPDYKYVADIYVGATLVARIKKVPQPDNKRGVFNIGDIVRNYMALVFNTAPNLLVSQEIGLNGFFLDVTVKFGEEYGFTLYTNLLVDTTRRYFNHYNGRSVGQNTALTPYFDKVASIRPYEVAVNINDKFTFIPYLPLTNSPFNVIINKYNCSGGGTPPATVNIQWGYFATDPYSTVDSQTIQFSTTVAQGANTLALNYTAPAEFQWLVLKEPITEPIKTTWNNTQYNYGTIPDQVWRTPIIIGSFRYYVSRIPVVLDSTTYIITFAGAIPSPYAPIVSNTVTITVTPSDANVLQILNVSPKLINYLYPGFIDSNVCYYTVQFGATSIYRFDINCDPKFEVYRVHFLNKFGGFETRNFNKVSRKVLAITKSEFGKLPYTIDVSGNVNYFNGNNIYNEQQSVYASQYTEKITLNSDILTDAEYKWLAQLVLSTLVYIEIDGYFVPCAILQTNYTFNKHINDKLTNLTMDVTFGEIFNAQYR